MERLQGALWLHLQSCSPRRAWLASSWEIREWRDFWRRAKSPVERKDPLSSLLGSFCCCYGKPQWGNGLWGCVLLLIVPLFFHSSGWIVFLCWVVLSVLSNAYLSTHSDHEGDGADHLQNERDTQHLLPDVALETQTTQWGQESNWILSGSATDYRSSRFRWRCVWSVSRGCFHVSEQGLTCVWLVWVDRHSPCPQESVSSKC